MIPMHAMPEGARWCECLCPVRHPEAHGICQGEAETEVLIPASRPEQFRLLAPERMQGELVRIPTCRACAEADPSEPAYV